MLIYHRLPAQARTGEKAQGGSAPQDVVFVVTCLSISFTTFNWVSMLTHGVLLTGLYAFIVLLSWEFVRMCMRSK
jgi:hypothetical protein